MFYQLIDQTPFRFFNQIPNVHFHARADAPEAEETQAEETVAWAPVVDVFETPESYRLVCEVPGFTAEAIDLKVEKGILTVSGETQKSAEVEGVKLVRNERRHGKFARTFALPREVNATGIQAAYNSGLLEITLPKSADLLPRKVEIAGK